jgi:toxin ParE1/3/4
MVARAGRYRLSPLAERDLEDIWSYTAEIWSWEQAERYHADMLAPFQRLASGEAHGRRVDVREGYLKYPVGSHFVFYQDIEGVVDVIRILHQRMDVGLHL